MVFPKIFAVTRDDFISFFLLFRACNFNFLCFAPFLCSLFIDSRVFDSEYSSRFVQPTKFKYVDGLWIETPISTEATYNVKVSEVLSIGMIGPLR